MAASLQEAGARDFLIIDQAGDFGGVWYWNRYPGIRCDVESYIYMPLLEEVGTVPTEKYATGAEMLEHARDRPPLRSLPARCWAPSSRA
jgi:cyclohexanone monooxygenase